MTALILTNTFVGSTSPKRIIMGHIITFCFRQKLYDEILSNNSIFHTFDNMENNTTWTYVSLSILPLLVLYFIKDANYQKSFDNLKRGQYRKTIRNVEFILLTIFMLLAKDVKNSF